MKWNASYGVLENEVKIVIVKNREEGSAAGARMFVEQIKTKPDSVLGLATGSSPVDLYRELVKAHRLGEAAFFRTKTFNLDEYIGLPKTHEQSYNCFMRRHLFDFIDVREPNIHLPDGMAGDFEKAAADYEAAIAAAGGIDLQLLGIGSNGHIGFNEPGCDLKGRTHVQQLTSRTIEDNARLFFGGDVSQVPVSALTMGLGTIMDARRCVLLAFGAKKAPAVRAMVQGPIDSSCPASVLQRHPDTTVILDVAAAEFLTKGNGS